MVTWYHLAFFAISAAMLGMTAGAVNVYLRAPERGSPDVLRRASDASALFALVVPLTLVVLTRVPITLADPVLMVVGLLAVTLACALPYYYAGIALTLVLTRSAAPVARVYAADLVGAATGCLLVLGALEVMDVPSLILLCGAFAGAASVAYARGGGAGSARSGQAALLLLSVLTVLGMIGVLPIAPTTVKGRRAVPELEVLDRWNSFSRVVVYRPVDASPWYWGASPAAPATVLRQFYMNIDGEAGTSLGPYRTDEDVSHLAWDVTNVAYFLRPSGGAAIIGVGGGRDVQAAVSFGHERVVGVEVNPVFVNILEEDLREFAGLADRPGVRFVVDDARSYLARSREEFALIQMSMIDTWAATGVGAYAHTESGLYTLEGWGHILDRLRPDGIFTVSRWHDPVSLGETARVVSLAVATLLGRGVERPEDHLALVTTSRLSTLLMARSPLTPRDLGTLEEVANAKRYSLTFFPGTPPSDPLLAGLLRARSMSDIKAQAADADLDVRPPTDDRPYFFNMLRLGDALRELFMVDGARELRGGVLRGNLIATGVLVGLLASLIVVAGLTIVVPLLLRGGGLRGRHQWAGAAYFSVIGAAFMLVEIGLIQRLSLVLGHPVYALGVLLFTIILSTGVGSFLSERLPLDRAPWRWAWPMVTAVAVAGLTVVLPIMADAVAPWSRPARIVVSVAVIFPVGVLLGFFFPTGMALASRTSDTQTPWFWALNGVMGVVASALAVFIAIHVGIRVNLWIGAGLYALSALALRGMEPGPRAASTAAEAA